MLPVRVFIAGQDSHVKLVSPVESLALDQLIDMVTALEPGGVCL